jgi:hypothetical protein
MAWVTRRITYHIIFLHVHFLDVQFIRQVRQYIANQ